MNPMTKTCVNGVVHINIDTNFRIAYPLTEVRVRGVSNEKGITEDNRRYVNR